jgi:hypothetical protein
MAMNLNLALGKKRGARANVKYFSEPTEENCLEKCNKCANLPTCPNPQRKVPRLSLFYCSDFRR